MKQTSSGHADDDGVIGGFIGAIGELLCRWRVTRWIFLAALYGLGFLLFLVLFPFFVLIALHTQHPGEPKGVDQTLNKTYG